MNQHYLAHNHAAPRLVKIKKTFSVKTRCIHCQCFLLSSLTMIFHNDIGVLVTLNEHNQGVLPPIYLNTFSNQVFVSQVSVEKMQ